MSGGYEVFKIRGIAIRVHGSLVFLGVMLAIIALGEGGSPADVGWRLMAPGVLFLTVLIHELGHAFTARAHGQVVKDVVLTPLGGAARLQGAVRSPVAEARVALAGPAANLVLAALAAGILLLQGQFDLESLKRIVTLDIQSGDLLIADPLRCILAFNLLLGTLNLLPAFPMDGGRILRALLWLSMGKLAATRIACRLGIWCAIGLFVSPFFVTGVQWWILPLVGLTLFLANVRERVMVEASEGVARMSMAFSMGTESAQAQAQSRAQPASQEEDDIIEVKGTSRVIDDKVIE